MFFNRVRSLFSCSWTYLWLFWFILIVVLVYMLRGPLKISEQFENASNSASTYFNNLTPKFYVALTGTSSLVSGIILIFEWWYFRNNGVDASSDEGSDNEDNIDSSRAIPALECKYWRNPLGLFRGAEYNRVKKETGIEPLSYFDMNLSAQDHQSLFTCEEDIGRPDYEIMQVAWRERDSYSRINAAHEALSINPECAPAMILLAEEECETVSDAEAMLRKALVAAETAYIRSQTAYQYGDIGHRRDGVICAYIRRRLAMCARKQGRLREAIKMMREIVKFPLYAMLGLQENLIEAFLEMQAYADVQALLVRYDGFDIREPKSAVLCYTSALLKTRNVSDKYGVEVRRGLSAAEQTAVDAIRRAIEFNPHVPQYLLEIRPLILPPEHYLRRADSEALAYAFFHIHHWKRIDGALHLLECTWKGVFNGLSRSTDRLFYSYSQQLESADRELLPEWHQMSVFPRKENPLWGLGQSLVCLAACVVALIVHNAPSSTYEFLVNAIHHLWTFFAALLSYLYTWVPENVQYTVVAVYGNSATFMAQTTSIIVSNDGKRVVESLLNDLRALSTEAKKKYNSVKEAAESAVVKVRNISTNSNDASLLTNLRAGSSELLHPLLTGCSTRNSRLVQISLQAIQRLVEHRILETASAAAVVSELWSLLEAGCEELRLLQTLTPFVCTDLLVSGPNLARCLVICFRLNYSKDPIVINTASATIRNLAGNVFLRVQQEDGMRGPDTVPPTIPRNTKAPPASLRPCAADAYMFFRDLCLLVNGEQPIWLTGIDEISRTLGLELLEATIGQYPSVFFKHPEFAALLKEDVCPLVIKLFSPNVKNFHGSYQNQNATAAGANSPLRPQFPIAMRLIRILVHLIGHYHQLLATECEIFLSLLLKFLESDKLGWQRALSLEALHRLLSQGSFLLWLVRHFDKKASAVKVCENSFKGVASYVASAFTRNNFSSSNSDGNGADFSNGPNSVPNAGFRINGSGLIPLVDIQSKRGLFLEYLEKHDAPQVQDGYCLSRAAAVLADSTQALFAAVDHVQLNESSENSPPAEQNGNEPGVEDDLALFTACYPSLLSSVSLLLEASNDESTSDSMLNCLSTLSMMACKLKEARAREACLYAFCSSALPGRNYLQKYCGLPPPTALSNFASLLIFSGEDKHEENDLGIQQVMATGTPCPSIHYPMPNAHVMLTAKNMQCLRLLLGCASAVAGEVGASWPLVLVTLQQTLWLLAMRPYLSGLYTKSANDQETAGPPSTSTVTTAARGDVPIVASMVDKIFEEVRKGDDVALHHLIAALAKLSGDALTLPHGAREAALFPLAKLLHTGTVNLFRMHIYWQPLTHHIIEDCNHSNNGVREWAATGLTSLLRVALQAKTDLSQEEKERFVLGSLVALSANTYADVRTKQIECLVAILHNQGSQLHPSMWKDIIAIIADVVDPQFKFGDQLIKDGYDALHLVTSDFLQQLPWECVEQLVEAVKRYGMQTAEQNKALSAISQLWTISDFVFRRNDIMGADAAEKVWLVVYVCLSELCVDGRSAVRKSGVSTLLQTIAAHGHALRPTTWRHMIWQIILPLVDKVRAQWRGASTERMEGGEKFLVHHSRDTEAKQWTETAIATLHAVCRVFTTQRNTLLQLEDFDSAWESLLGYLEWGASTSNAELSLASLKCFQEVLLGKVSAQTLDMNTREKSSTSLKELVAGGEVPPLPQKLWIVSWKSWIRMAKSLYVVRPPADDPKEAPYVPGPSHLTTLLHIFPPLFERVKRDLAVDELHYDNLPSTLEAITFLPIATAQSPFVLHQAGTLTPTQEAVMDAVKGIYVEMISPGSCLRGALPSLLKLLLKFAVLAAQPPARRNDSQRDYREWACAQVIPFAESSLRLCVESFAATAHYREVVEAGSLIEFVQVVSKITALKYACVSPSSWRLAASALLNVLRIGLPIARQHPTNFTKLWPELSTAFDTTLFSPNGCSTLNPDERKRDEYIDCSFVELIRAEILPFCQQFPPEFVGRIIDILNRGSICALDPTDVLESYTQRVELSRACFDALLSMSKDDSKDELIREKDPLALAALTSLIERCKQVLNSFSRDGRGAGEMRLPAIRLAETTSCLTAVQTLIDRLAGRPDAVSSPLYSQLVLLHPTLVELIPCCHADPQVESALVSALKAYQTLLLLKALPAHVS
ncbi:unnamed protein product, partial [Mesorhabditis spiculigera]